MLVPAQSGETERVIAVFRSVGGCVGVKRRCYSFLENLSVKFPFANQDESLSRKHIKI